MNTKHLSALISCVPTLKIVHGQLYIWIFIVLVLIFTGGQMELGHSLVFVFGALWWLQPHHPHQPSSLLPVPRFSSFNV